MAWERICATDTRCGSQHPFVKSCPRPNFHPGSCVLATRAVTSARARRSASTEQPALKLERQRTALPWSRMQSTLPLRLYCS
jgi:hypothetical protein